VPRISICIPPLDRLGDLREALGSAQAQSVPDFVVLIGDDGDSAEAFEWAPATSALDPRVR